MKKVFVFAVMAIAALTTNAQNIQLHYDFGRNIYPDQQPDRQKVTITLEQFKADKWGSWYYFVDLDLSRKFLRSAYTEISREVNLGKQSPFAAHVEYAGLLGVAYIGHTAAFSPTWSVQMLYNRFFKSYEGTSAYHSAQLTGVWGTTTANKKLTFSGFIDFWRGEKANGHGMLVILSEPQLWYNATENLSIGTEVEISNNFIYNTYNDKTFFINPTLAFKWNF